MLAQITVELTHGRTKTLAELVEGWVQHVDRLHAERNRDAAKDPHVWGAHDYLAALHLRSMVALALNQQGTEVGRAANMLVAPADEKFESFTAPDLEHVVDRFAGQPHDDSAWWWNRIPTSGPVRAELLRAVKLPGGA